MAHSPAGQNLIKALKFYPIGEVSYFSHKYFFILDSQTYQSSYVVRSWVTSHDVTDFPPSRGRKIETHSKLQSEVPPVPSIKISIQDMVFRVKLGEPRKCTSLPKNHENLLEASYLFSAISFYAFWSILDRISCVFCFKCAFLSNQQKNHLDVTLHQGNIKSS